MNTRTLILVCAVSASALLLTGCEAEDVTPLKEVEKDPISFEVELPTAEKNQQQISATNATLEALIDSNNKSKKEINDRLDRIEKNIADLIIRVDSNTSMYELLKKEVNILASKVTNFFQKKVAVKTIKKKKRRVAQVKPKYKAIGIDTWGSFKYVQLINESGELFLLREGEKVDEWEVSDVGNSGAILINSKGNKLNLKVSS